MLLQLGDCIWRNIVEKQCVYVQSGGEMALCVTAFLVLLCNGFLLWQKKKSLPELSKQLLYLKQKQYLKVETRGR